MCFAQSNIAWWWCWNMGFWQQNNLHFLGAGLSAEQTLPFLSWCLLIYIWVGSFVLFSSFCFFFESMLYVMWSYWNCSPSLKGKHQIFVGTQQLHFSVVYRTANWKHLGLVGLSSVHPSLSQPLNHFWYLPVELHLYRWNRFCPVVSDFFLSWGQNKFPRNLRYFGSRIKSNIILYSVWYR